VHPASVQDFAYDLSNDNDALQHSLRRSVSMSMQTTVDLLKVVFELGSICVTLCGGVRIIGGVWVRPRKRKRGH
jgi:hypothetical protein